MKITVTIPELRNCNLNWFSLSENKDIINFQCEEIRWSHPCSHFDFIQVGYIVTNIGIKLHIFCTCNTRKVFCCKGQVSTQVYVRYRVWNTGTTTPPLLFSVQGVNDKGPKWMQVGRSQLYFFSQTTFPPLYLVFGAFLGHICTIVWPVNIIIWDCYIIVAIFGIFEIYNIAYCNGGHFHQHWIIFSSFHNNLDKKYIFQPICITKVTKYLHYLWEVTFGDRMYTAFVFVGVECWRRCSADNILPPTDSNKLLSAQYICHTNYS